MSLQRDFYKLYESNNNIDVYQDYLEELDRLNDTNNMFWYRLERRREDREKRRQKIRSLEYHIW